MAQNRSNRPVRFTGKTLDLKERHNLIEKLLACPCLNADESRRSFINGLPDELKHGMLRGVLASGRQEVTNLLETCLNYEGGLPQLLDSIRFYDKGTKQFAELESYLLAIGLMEYEPVETPPAPSGSFPANPFIDTQKVQGQRFVGRQTNRRRLNTILQASSVHLSGAMKIGKSSLLHLLFKDIAGQGERAVFGDFQDQTMDEIVSDIALELELERNVSWAVLRRKLARQPFYLFLDELDYAPQMGLTEEWGRRLRALAGDNVRLITGARRYPGAILPHRGAGSDWYNFLSPEPLDVFTPTEAEQLLRSRLPADLVPQIFPATKVQQLIELSGCHPFKLTRAAFRYYDFLTNEPHSNWQKLYHNDLVSFGLTGSDL
jgi:Effector-associated domain 2